MSLASEYADRQTAARLAGVEANASVPDPFHRDSFDAMVTEDGDCLITPGTGTGQVLMDKHEAVEFCEWITATFTDL
jgi:hypothetical protein